MEEVVSGVPDQPDAPIVQIINLDVKVQWTEPNDNHATVTAYEVTLAHSDGTTFTAETQYCDASQELIILQRYCLIPHSVLVEAPFSLTFDTLIQAKVRAINRNGQSALSDANSENPSLDDKIEDVPDVIMTLAEGTLTNESQIELEWDALTGHVEIGGSDVTSYNLQWDAGQHGLEWTHLVGFESDSLDLSYRATGSIIPSHTYQFRIRAQNKWGWGEWSSIVHVKASTWPEVVAEPTTAIDPDNGNVIVTWAAPDARGSDIISYLIEFQDATDPNTWTEDVIYCNGAAPEVIAEASCSIPMSRFTSGILAFNYSLGELILVRVTATNEKGSSDAPSAVSTGSATAKVVPA